MIQTGNHNEYYWVTFEESSCSNFIEILIVHHLSQYLHISAFDGSSIEITDEERKQGWIQEDEIMISPKLKMDIEIPYDNYDEWYFSPEKIKFPNIFHLFVNNDGFTPKSIDSMLQTYEPSWEKNNPYINNIRSLQELFWKQINLLSPITYVSMGAIDIVVTKDQSLISKLIKDSI